MWFPSLFLSLVLALKPGARRRPTTHRNPAPRRWSFVPRLEGLEDRTVLSTLTFTAGPLIQVSQDPDPLAGCDDGFRPDGNMNFSDQFETRVAVDPSNPQHLVATWVGHDLQANFVGVSFDGGATWRETALPGSTPCTGGTFTSAVDDYLLSISPNGNINLASVAFSDVPSAILVNRSTDGGLTWTAPITINQVNDANLFDDKPTTTADPTNPLIAYVGFERDNGYDNNDAMFFSRTTDGGQTWEAAREIADPGLNNYNTGQKILVLPNGTLVSFFSHEVAHPDASGQVTYTTNVATLRSPDHGQTWLPANEPILGPEIKSIDPTNPDLGATDPDTGIPLNEFTAGVAFAAVDRHSGTLYAVWEDSRFSHGQYDSIAFSQSTDGGSTWSKPIAINQTPDNIPPAERQAFRPSIAVAADGTIGVTYYDFRFNNARPGTPTDYWFVSSRPETATSPASWHHEVRLTDSSFDLQTAPLFFGGEFVGDSDGLASVGNDFVGTWSMPHGADQGNIYFRRLTAGQDGAGDKSASPAGPTADALKAARGAVPSGPAPDAAAIALVLSGSLPAPMAALPGSVSAPVATLRVAPAGREGTQPSPATPAGQAFAAAHRQAVDHFLADLEDSPLADALADSLALRPAG
ncbi:MAG: hypothetical protein ACJ8F7_20925 [Gemmataceae bacterium]